MTIHKKMVIFKKCTLVKYYFIKRSGDYLERYQWPGNIRELENLVERVVALAGDAEIWIKPDLLPDDVKPGQPFPEISVSETGPLHTVVEAIERKMIKQALQDSNGNKTRAAASLGLSRRGLINKLERYHL